MKETVYDLIILGAGPAGFMKFAISRRECWLFPRMFPGTSCLRWISYCDFMNNLSGFYV